jgi:hypothetical protein
MSFKDKILEAMLLLLKNISFHGTGYLCSVKTLETKMIIESDTFLRENNVIFTKVL